MSKTQSFKPGYMPLFFNIVGLTALAIVLKLKVFEIPYPPAPFLKYDLSGIPLAIIAFMSLKAYPASLFVYFLVHALMTADPAGLPIDMAMKALAELSTSVPIAIALKKKELGKTGVVLATIGAVVSRVALMTLMTLLVGPYWLVMARWTKTYEQAYQYALLLIPHIVVFNATLALIVAFFTVLTLKRLKSSGMI